METEKMRIRAEEQLRMNTGNKDIENFDFGITLDTEISIINVNVKGKDRHHTITYRPEISFNQKSNIIDFNLSPFNRKDTYEITLFLTSDNNLSIEDVSKLEFSSTLPVKFIEIDALSKTLLEIMKEGFPPLMNSIGILK